MAIPTIMADLSTTAASNSPSGSENPSTGDDFLRAVQAILRTTNAKGSDIASATTTDIGAATGEFIDVTGTTTITGLGTIAAGIRRLVRFTGILTLTHNATSLILPSSANITTANGDFAEFRSLGSGNWVCSNYMRKDGTPVVTVAAPFIDSTAIIKGSADATKLLRIEVDGLTTATTRVATMPDKDITIAGLSDINGGVSLGSKIQPITATVAANALTVTLNPTVLDFRTTTLNDGTVFTRSNAAAISIVVPSTATLGTTNGVAARLAVLAFVNGGVIDQLGIVNVSGGVDLSETSLVTTTAISAAATSAGVIYTTSARTNVAYRVVGYIDITEATAGTWATAPTVVQGAGGQSLTHINALVSGTAVASTSGTSIDFTGIPIWAKRITAMLAGVSTSGTSLLTFQLGKAAGVETSGYLGAGSISEASTATSNATTGFNIYDNTPAATDIKHGSIVFSLLDPATNTWVANGNFAASSTATTYLVAGSKALAGILDRVRLTTVGGADTFDAGLVNIIYE